MIPDPLTGIIGIGKSGIGKSIIGGIASGVTSEITSIAFKKLNDRETGRRVAEINHIQIDKDSIKRLCVSRLGGKYYEIGRKMAICEIKDKKC